MTPKRGDRSDEAFERQWRKRFEEFARTHDDDAGISGWSETGLDTRIRQFLRHWSCNRKGERWLDAGCGPGTYTGLLLKHDVDVLAMDYSLPTLEKAKARNVGKVSWILGDINELPIRANTFDGIICFGVMQAISGSDRAVNELVKALKPHGEVWIDALNSWCIANLAGQLKRRFLGKSRHLRYESPYTLSQVLRSEGIKEIKIYWLPLVPQRWVIVRRIVDSPLFTGLLTKVPLLGLLFSHAYVVRGKLATPEKQM